MLGTAEVVQDEQTKAEMWEDEWQQFFTKGKDDPEYCLLKVSAETVEYRDQEKTGFESTKVL